jgi:hypothetical protein
MRWTLEQLDTWLGREALDAEGETAGTIIATFVDEDNTAPRWLGVRTGEHGDDLSPVPIEGAEPTGAAIRLPHPLATILAAPHVPPSGGLSPEQDEQLVSFYGLS